MTLRERLVALARSQKLALTLNLDEMVDVSWHTREEFAFAAARMALEDAAATAETWGGLPPSPQGRRKALAAAIRNLRDGLD